MTKHDAIWLKTVALIALLPATMANKGGCSPDVDMGSDAEATGGASVGGAATVNDSSQGSATTSATKGGAPGVSQTADKGGAPATGDSSEPITEKGGASAYLKCTSKDWCSGEQPKVAPCPNGNSPNIDCVGTPDGSCVWEAQACPASAMCSQAMCGTKPDFKPCEGDISGGVTCEPDASGVCQWQQHCSDPPLCRAKCGPQPTERGTCPDGTLKAIYCDFVNAKGEKYVPCSELEAIGSQWVEQPCVTSVSCDGVDEVILLTRYLATNLDQTKFSTDPLDARALCKEAFRQPLVTQPNLSCIDEHNGYGYELIFVDHEGAEGAMSLVAFVLPHGECDTMSTTQGGTISVRTPGQSLWDQLNEFVGVNMQEQ